MISYLEGTVVAKNPTDLVVDVGGIGFFVHIPLSSYEAIQDVGTTARILTYLYVREDAMALYGFATEGERELFEMLISVSGIGPPMAQKILSGISVADFKRFISTEEATGLTRIKGVGQKLARRLVVELRDKVAGISFGPEAGVATEGDAGDRLEEATSALVGLGANPFRARKAVMRVFREDRDGMSVEEIIRQALRGIG